ncbi:hypothetical protein BDQ12DRAFT_684370 [Crucibulum laeve]|uniref:Uncharacterized protein n=1 Tax=Crucibulum laeve TaxID=68775 RepID=A0A5C3LZE0_9AGAR|nr:hypothetical protein BDQ12DRAFT_684370 [Crucibulum laeve]
MDFLKKAMASTNSNTAHTTTAQPTAHKDDPLDKAIDFVQEHVFKQGSQKNESAAEQAKDAKIASGIKSLFKKATGKEFPGGTNH